MNSDDEIRSCPAGYSAQFDHSWANPCDAGHAYQTWSQYNCK